MALAAPVDEAELFKSKCGKCHDSELALKDYRSAEVWQETIARMKEDHSAEISEEEAEKLVKYHVERQNQEVTIFKQKCEKCHPGEVFLEKSYHSRSQKAVLEENLEVFAEPGSDQQGRNKEMNVEGGMALFAEKCSECHELGRALSVIKDPEIWDQTI